MVHLRLNEKETTPNPYINFITALPGSGEEPERARHLLRALAAQVKPVMKTHGFTVNSFEEVRVTKFHYPPPEHRLVWGGRVIGPKLTFSNILFVQYEWNTVFAGRNWNAGETIGQSFITLSVYPVCCRRFGRVFNSNDHSRARRNCPT
jgi:hypothetical protein